MGVNALEPDIEYFPDKASDPVSKGFYIAHQVGGIIAPFSNYSEPTLSFHDYLDQLSAFLAKGQTQLSLVEPDVKKEPAYAPGALAYIVSTIKTEILPDHPELYFLLNVGTIDEANHFFTSTADVALKDIPVASRSHFGFSIDGEDDASKVATRLHTLLGADAQYRLRGRHGGMLRSPWEHQRCPGIFANCRGKALLVGDPELAALDLVALAAGQFIYLGPHVGPALQAAVAQRAATWTLST